MKIRHGFVSNSSSTSFAVYLPKSVVGDIIVKNADDLDLCDAIRRLARGETIYQEEEEYDVFERISEFLNPYTLVEFNVTSDGCGEIRPIDEDKIKEIENTKT